MKKIVILILVLGCVACVTSRAVRKPKNAGPPVVVSPIPVDAVIVDSAEMTKTP